MDVSYHLPYEQQKGGSIFRVHIKDPHQDSPVQTNQANTIMITKPLSTQPRNPTASPHLPLPQPPKHLPPLRHHMRIKHIRTGHINRQHRPQRPLALPPPLLPRRPRSRINQPALARNPQRIQHEESVVAQPRQPAGDAAEVQVVREVAVADDLGRAPGEQHGGVSRRGGGRAGEVEGDAPD
jgi:hypothetical protein